MNFARGVTRTAVPLALFAAGYLLLPKEWRKQRPEHVSHNQDVLAQIKQSNLFQKLKNDPLYKFYHNSEMIPAQHRDNHVGSGLLFGSKKFEIDPLVFVNEKEGRLTSFHYAGPDLAGHGKTIHNGAIAIIMDEGLCQCGFARLPSKKGVTAKLELNFKQGVPPGALVLDAHVTQAKGRKVVIEGTVRTFDEPSIEVATALCIMVEPRWFRYILWLF